MHRALALVVALVATAGCAIDEGYLPIVATRPVDLDLRKVDVNHLPVKHGVEGSDTRATSFLLIPTQDPPRLERAVERALSKSGGDVLSRVHVWSRQWWFLFASVETITVRGDSVDIPEVDMPPGPHIAAISTENPPAIGFQTQGAPRVQGVEGESEAHTYLWVPTRTMSPTLQEAVEKTLARGDGDLITDAQIDHWWWYVPFIYGSEGWRVRGDVLRTR
ncbi:MAG TPA: hypothetical protein VMH82_15035 [Myxococcota bacterium]|nr:hypothetical protein [Myxococcota bacterium]